MKKMPPHDSLGRNLDTGINPQNEDFRKEMNPETRRFETASILDNILNDDEKRIISQVPNPEIRDIIMEIINELGKSICNGENPSSQLFDEICTKVVYKHNKGGSGVYYGYTRQIIKQLPDWKDFAGSFDKNYTSSSNNSVLEFRKKRGGVRQTQQSYTTKTIDYSTAETDHQQVSQETVFSAVESKQETVQPQAEPIKEPKEKKSKHEKIKANYGKISTIGYKGKISKFKRTEDLETDIPLLEPEDIGICQYMNGWVPLTKNTKVPCCRWLDNKADFEKIGIKDYYIDNIFVGNGDKPYCYYNPIDDVSHIVTFCTSRGGNINTEIIIKGKISQQDAIELFKYVKEKTGLETDRTNGNQPKKLLDGSFVQQLVMEYFNSK